MDKTLLASVEERIARLRRERDYYRSLLQEIPGGDKMRLWATSVLTQGDRIRRGEDEGK